MGATEFSAETYADVAIAYWEMAMLDDALDAIREGLRRYPLDKELLKLANDERFRALLNPQE